MAPDIMMSSSSAREKGEPSDVGVASFDEAR